MNFKCAELVDDIVRTVCLACFADSLEDPFAVNLADNAENDCGIVLLQGSEVITAELFFVAHVHDTDVCVRERTEVLLASRRRIDVHEHDDSLCVRIDFIKPDINLLVVILSRTADKVVAAVLDSTGFRVTVVDKAVTVDKTALVVDDGTGCVKVVIFGVVLDDFCLSLCHERATEQGTEEVADALDGNLGFNGAVAASHFPTHTDKDMGKDGLYEKVMGEAVEEFFSIEPYKTFRNRFNVYSVKAVSKNDRLGEGNETALGTFFGTGSYISGNQDKCFEYALKVPGITDRNNLLVSVLVNTRRYAGTNFMFESTQSSVAFVPTMGNDRSSFGIILRHEACGHGFGFLDDEYFDIEKTPSQSYIDYRKSMYEKYGWFSNIDFTNDPKKVKWSAFLSDDRYKDEVGIFEGATLHTTGAYRPSENSMMRENMEYFNAPSRWAIYKRIMELSGEEASFEKFLEYDAINRGQKQKDSAPRTRSGIIIEHTPPVVLP